MCAFYFIKFIQLKAIFVWLFRFHLLNFEFQMKNSSHTHTKADETIWPCPILMRHVTIKINSRIFSDDKIEWENICRINNCNERKLWRDVSSTHCIGHRRRHTISNINGLIENAFQFYLINIVCVLCCECFYVLIWITCAFNRIWRKLNGRLIEWFNQELLFFCFVFS